MTPTSVSSIPSLWSSIDFTKVIPVGFLIIFAIWLIYTLVASYHLLRYGHRSSVSIPAIITHILVSGFLAIYAISGFTQ